MKLHKKPKKNIFIKNNSHYFIIINSMKIINLIFCKKKYWNKIKWMNEKCKCNITYLTLKVIIIVIFTLVYIKFDQISHLLSDKIVFKKKYF